MHGMSKIRADWYFVVLNQINGAGLFTTKHDIKNHQKITFQNFGHQHKAPRSAIHKIHVFRNVVILAQIFQSGNAKAFITKQCVANAEYQCFLCRQISAPTYIIS